MGVRAAQRHFRPVRPTSQSQRGLMEPIQRRSKPQSRSHGPASPGPSSLVQLSIGSDAAHNNQRMESDSSDDDDADWQMKRNFAITAERKVQIDHARIVEKRAKELRDAAAYAASLVQQGRPRDADSGQAHLDQLEPGWSGLVPSEPQFKRIGVSVSFGDRDSGEAEDEELKGSSSLTGRLVKMQSPRLEAADGRPYTRTVFSGGWDGSEPDLKELDDELDDDEKALAPRSKVQAATERVSRTLGSIGVSLPQGLSALRLANPSPVPRDYIRISARLQQNAPGGEAKSSKEGEASPRIAAPSVSVQTPSLNVRSQGQGQHQPQRMGDQDDPPPFRELFSPGAPERAPPRSSSFTPHDTGRQADFHLQAAPSGRPVQWPKPRDFETATDANQKAQEPLTPALLSSTPRSISFRSDRRRKSDLFDEGQLPSLSTSQVAPPRHSNSWRQVQPKRPQSVAGSSLSAVRAPAGDFNRSVSEGQEVPALGDDVEHAMVVNGVPKTGTPSGAMLVNAMLVNNQTPRPVTRSG